MPVRATGERDATVVAVGERKTVTVCVPAEAFRRWDGGWVVDRGPWRVLVGASATDVRMELAVDVT